jgi:hypothetical protein
MEVEHQGVDLHEITGCRLSDVVSLEEDDVEGLEEALQDEAEEDA